MFSLPSSLLKQPPDVQEALAYTARGAVIPPNDTASYLILGVFLATAIGLFGWQPWARKLLVALLVVFVVLRGLRGIAVATAFSAALSVTFTLLTGVIAALVYTAPLASRFAATGGDDGPLEDDGDGATSGARPEKLIAVCEIESAAEVREIFALLESTGLNFITSDEGLGGQFEAGRSGVREIVGPVRFLVRAEDADAARAVLSVFRLSGRRS